MVGICCTMSTTTGQTKERLCMPVRNATLPHVLQSSLESGSTPQLSHMLSDNNKLDHMHSHPQAQGVYLH